MNCEKCKSKKATVFYADESGGRHSLCASCAATLGKVSSYDPNAGEQGRSQFIPEPTLLSLTETGARRAIYFSADSSEESAVCPTCSTALCSLISGGYAGCPECYTVFCEHLFPTALTPESAKGARMPSSRRESLDRIRSIGELRNKIRLAVESENYELAASLRDEIRRLEAKKHP